MGLQISKHVEHYGIVAGRPVRTPQGNLSVLIEYPPGHLHPIALLQYVSGKPLDWSEPPAPEMIGTLLAKLHALPLPQHFHLTREDILHESSQKAPSMYGGHEWLFLVWGLGGRGW